MAVSLAIDPLYPSIFDTRAHRWRIFPVSTSCWPGRLPAICHLRRGCACSDPRRKAFIGRVNTQSQRLAFFGKPGRRRQQEVLFTQILDPLDNLTLTCLVALIPVVALLVLLAVFRWPAWL